MSKIQDFKMYINGEWVASSSGKKIESLNPENNEVWATVPEADKKDVDKVIRYLDKYLSDMADLGLFMCVINK